MTIAYRTPSHPGMGYPAFVEPKPPRRVEAPAGDETSPPRRPDASAFPSLDDDLVRPETREEMVGGRLLLSPPAKEPHAERHHELDFVTRGVVAPGYIGATDLLTRTSGSSQFAADTCIRREGIDPATGTRYLEDMNRPRRLCRYTARPSYATPNHPNNRPTCAAGNSIPGCPISGLRSP